MKILNPFAIVFFAFLSTNLSFAQKIIADPETPTFNDEVTLTFDITQCDRGDLLGFTGDVYVHTGVYIKGGTEWDYVVADWSENIEKAKCTKVSDNVYEITLSPDINSFYGVAAGDTVTSLNFVIRSADQSLKSEDLFYTVYEPGLTIEITQPEGNIIVNKGEELQVQARSVYLGTTAPTSLSLTVDNFLEHISFTDTLDHPVSIADTGIHWIHVKGMNASFMAQDSISVYVKEPLAKQDLPDGVVDGINYHGDTAATLVLYAPGKDNVFLIGDFNDWELSNDFQLINTTDGNRWWITIDELQAGTEYAFQYLVNANLRIADPYTEKILDPWNDEYIPETTYPNLKTYPEGKTTEIVSILETGQEGFPWEEFLFIPPEKEDLVIYEVHVQNFTDAATVNMLTDTLNYLEQLGVNAIELMPVNEFEGNQSWGYNPSFYFAFDKIYGTKEDMQNFVQECHKRGIAVIVDMVLNHSFGQSPMVRLYWDNEAGKPSIDNPWFNPDPKHDFNVGYDMNHDSEQTKVFSKRVMKFWLEEYQIDGFRFDLSKGFTQNNTLGDTETWGNFDATRVALWKEYADTIWGVKNKAYVILEHLADNDEEKELANYGLMLWSNMNYNYNEATLGYHDDGKSNMSWASYTTREWDNPHAIVYMESHDEERLMYKNTQWGANNESYDVRSLATALQRIETAAAFFFTIPGPKMIWEWGELGYDFSINRCEDGTISEDCRLSPKPVEWDYFDVPERYRLYKVFEAMIDFKSLSICRTTDFDFNFADTAKVIHLNGADTNATIIGNFGIYNSTIVPEFQHTGTWYDYLTGESTEITDVTAPIKLKPGEYKIYTDIQLDVIELPAAPTIPDVTGTVSVPEGIAVFLYPNPLEGDLLNIEIDVAYTEPVSFELMDMNGRTLINRTINSSQNTWQLDISEIPSQILMYRMVSGKNIKQGLLIRE